MKKILVVLFAFLLALLMCVSAFAENENEFVYQRGNITIYFDSSTTFNAEQREAFVDILTGTNNQPSPCGLACLFGHKYEIASVTTVTHQVNSVQPKCLEETFELKQCTRCNKQVVERMGYMYIVCCE